MMGWKEWVWFPKCDRLQLEQGQPLVGGRHLREAEASLLRSYRLQGVGHSWIPVG